MKKIQSMCKNKQRYCTKKYADEIAVKMSLKYNRKFRVYKCSFCQGYHLTKKR